MNRLRAQMILTGICMLLLAAMTSPAPAATQAAPPNEEDIRARGCSHHANDPRKRKRASSASISTCVAEELRLFVELTGISRLCESTIEIAEMAIAQYTQAVVERYAHHVLMAGESRAVGAR